MPLVQGLPKFNCVRVRKLASFSMSDSLQITLNHHNDRNNYLNSTTKYIPKVTLIPSIIYIYTMRPRIIARESLSEKICRIFGYDPRPEQLEAIATLAIDLKDLILIAKTGWGKSMIFQCLPLLRGGICLIIFPLDLIEEEQVCLVFHGYQASES